MKLFKSTNSKKIEKLEQECSELKKALKSQEDISNMLFKRFDRYEWENRNVPKYKIGDKIKNEIVTSIITRQDSEYGPYYYSYFGINIKTGIGVDIL